mgnify:CR=1 FL=1
MPELQAQESLQPPELARLYVPQQHRKALSLDASVVVGMRGAGKSLWTAVLASEPHRAFVSEQIGNSLVGKILACVGFGLDETETHFPRPETLAALVGQGLAPADIWQTVVLRHALRTVRDRAAAADRSWREACTWVVENPDEANARLTACDEKLARNDRILLVLFDAFDRLATDWEQVRQLAKGALQVGLRLRSRRAIRGKFFVRPDLEEDDEIWRFPDSSKLRHNKVDLSWSSSDLYGLVIMHLGNDREFGEEFRTQLAREWAIGWQPTRQVYVPPQELTTEEKQRPVIKALADTTMGKGPKRGYTYSWIPLHLADAKGRISPRSFLLAFKKAAEHTAQYRPEHPLALHYGAIQQGVVKASEVRVDEINEDYPWVRPLLESLRGGVVPMTIEEVSSRWSTECLQEMRRAASAKLPPGRYTQDLFRPGTPNALVDGLVELAVLYRASDERLNMPDIFRVGFGIRRKGGVKPPR